jgi:hypothetical protein
VLVVAMMVVVMMMLDRRQLLLLLLPVLQLLVQAQMAQTTMPISSIFHAVLPEGDFLSFYNIHNYIIIIIVHNRHSQHTQLRNSTTGISENIHINIHTILLQSSHQESIRTKFEQLFREKEG